MVNLSSLFVQGSASTQLLPFLLLCRKPRHTRLSSNLPLCRVKEPLDSHRPGLESWKDVSDCPDVGTSVAQLGRQGLDRWDAELPFESLDEYAPEETGPEEHTV